MLDLPEVFKIWISMLFVAKDKLQGSHGGGRFQTHRQEGV